MHSLFIAGSTERTVQVARTLFEDGGFSLAGIITPAPRKIGRKQEITPNPLHQFALTHNIPVILVETKIDSSVKEEIQKYAAPDLLLVVDFGFWVPTWLLQWPTIAPLNIHPSLLPRWRGSTPGPNVLLAGETESAVTLMVMNEKMDEGPLLAQLPFTVDPTWTQTEYYQKSFDLICEKLSFLLGEFLTGKLMPQPQPLSSPTPLAEKLTKEKAFFDWKILKEAMKNGSQAEEIERASRAFYPWPKIWTQVSTSQGTRRMIIHRCSLTAEKKLQLDLVQLEGKSPCSWNELKNALLE